MPQDVNAAPVHPELSDLHSQSKCWAVIRGDGTCVYASISWKRSESIDRVLGGNRKLWATFRRLGWSCKRVRVSVSVIG